MNLKEIKEWAEGIDLLSVDEKKRHHAKCYKDMINEKALALSVLTDKMNQYMKDIHEYVAQLEKIGLSAKPKEEEVQPTVDTQTLEEKTDSEKKVSPLLP